MPALGNSTSFCRLHTEGNMTIPFEYLLGHARFEQLGDYARYGFPDPKLCCRLFCRRSPSVVCRYCRNCRRIQKSLKVFSAPLLLREQSLDNFSTRELETWSVEMTSLNSISAILSSWPHRRHRMQVFYWSGNPSSTNFSIGGHGSGEESQIHASAKT